jgi:hypothetical protein
LLFCYYNKREGRGKRRGREEERGEGGKKKSG